MTEPVKLKITFPADAGAIHLIAQPCLEGFMSSFGVEISAADLKPAESRAQDFEDTGDEFWDNPDLRAFRPYNVVRAADGTGVLVIPVRGNLLSDFPYQAGTYATGYDYVEACVRRGASDASVKAILLDISSGGGFVRGADECARSIAEACKLKAVIAYASGMMASAAYWLGSQGTKVLVSPTSEGVGSIGTTSGRWDRSALLEKEGVKLHAYKTGERKTDGNPYLPLTDEEIAARQELIEDINDEFLTAVSSARNISVQDIRKMEAGLFSAKKSVRIGLADAVSTRAEALMAAFGAKSEPQAETGINEGSDMTDKTKDTPKAEAEAAADITSGTAPAPVVDAGAVDAAVSAAVGAALTRVKDILGCDEAKGREAQANVFAFTTNLALDQVKQLLAAAPVAAPAPAPHTAANPFETAIVERLAIRTPLLG
ncbi:signal peptide peptidase SppA [Gemmobacter caeni]|uniref:Signal peptide peptidase SppA n=1 Tax=Gemmobacter caeni TaxID=589035 RepID=A0A2T6APT9_9RHOB|nr:S49 family peptidase [Gemmobacter caeni]PTX45841.1 signal peptide peptidase SppA [Gemmobacter caeni]TWI94146.1 signal peptide peptidase SppA [Gemmobacter caeni]